MDKEEQIALFLCEHTENPVLFLLRSSFVLRRFWLLAKKILNSFSDVIFAHEAFANEEGVKPGLMQGFQVIMARYAAFSNADDRGRQLLVLARRITVRRDQADIGRPSGESGLEIISRSKDQHESLGDGELPEARKRTVDETSWTEIAWCHPAAPSSYIVSSRYSDAKSENSYMKRSPVTALAAFGQSVAVSAGLDGGVFLAYSIHGGKKGVQGIHLDWGSASRSGASASLDGEYGVGKGFEGRYMATLLMVSLC